MANTGALDPLHSAGATAGVGRRAFIALLAAAGSWPLAARAQQPAKMLRVGYVGIQPRDAPIYLAFLSPVEQSTRFHMTVNLKTAAALGLSLPITFTARAHEVFE
jgi:hypothetical protein